MGGAAVKQDRRCHALVDKERDYPDHVKCCLRRPKPQVPEPAHQHAMSAACPDRLVGPTDTCRHNALPHPAALTGCGAASRWSVPRCGVSSAFVPSRTRECTHRNSAPQGGLCLQGRKRPRSWSALRAACSRSRIRPPQCATQRRSDPLPQRSQALSQA